MYTLALLQTAVSVALLLLRGCSKEAVSSTMLNNVTGDLQWDWVTHKNSKTMAVWCSWYDGFVCLWCLKSAHKHWHRDLPWTLPHKYRLVHIKLTSSLGYSLFHPPLPRSISSHTNVQANGYISAHWVGGRKNIPCWVYQAIWMWLCKWTLLDPCNSVDIWGPHWLW